MSLNHKEMRDKIVLAALLHDIGKFWQRADDFMQKSPHVKQWYEAPQWLVPAFDGKPGYQHAFWTFAFIRSQKEIFEKYGFDAEELANLSAKHHRPDPDSDEQRFISIADKWVSRNERVFADYAKTEDPQNEVKGWGRFAFKKIPMHSIFDLINRKGINESDKTYFPLTPLNVTEGNSIFPNVLRDTHKVDRTEEYAKLWDEFVEEFKELPSKCKTTRQFIIALQSILKKYTWCIPASTIDMPYASLFEHMKMVAGFSIALYDFYHEGNNNKNFNVEGYGNYGHQFQLVQHSKDPLLMVCVDLSGIQKFIFDIGSRSAAKALKGRSYYLQLLNKSILNEILNHQDINGYDCQVIYASGGKAYLVLPNTEAIQNALQTINNELEKQLFHSHRGKLYAALGSVSFRYQIKFKEGDRGYNMSIYSSHPALKSLGRPLELGDLWKVVSDEASKSKNRKFLSLINNSDNFKAFFTPTVLAEQMKMCSVTGMHFNAEELVTLNREQDEDNPPIISREVFQQIELGNQLKSASYITELYNEDKGKNHQVIQPGGLNTTFMINPDHFNYDLNYYAYNDFGSKKAHSVLFYGGNMQPASKERNLSFSEICLGEEGEQTKLGVLKMDVDSLGQIFINGLNDNDKSFSSYATLSFILEAFFSGYINAIRNDEKYKNNIQVIFSGGDDVFAVGRWDKVIDFAVDLNEAFHALTRRKDITLSAGIAIVGHKFPIAKAAEIADEAEKSSKNYSFKFKDENDLVIEKTKNAITFFNETVSWVDEFSFVSKMKERFYKNSKDLPKSLLMSLQQFKINKDDGIQKSENDGKHPNFSYVWQSVYKLTRLKDRLKKDSDERELVEEIIQNILHNNQFGSQRYLDLVALAARWTEYLLK